MKSPLVTGCFLAFLLLLAACKKHSVYPVTPEIQYLSLDIDSIRQFSGPMNLVISYQDGDGDLGDPAKEKPGIFLFVHREGISHIDTLTYKFKSITPETRNKSIKGTMTVTIETAPGFSYSLPGATFETCTYEIMLVDRAGHESNRVFSKPWKLLP